MRLILIIFAASYSSIVCAQLNRNCDILNTFFNNEKVQDVFGFNQYLTDSILIIDKKSKFTGCSTKLVCGRIVKIITDTSYSLKINHSNILVEDIYENGNFIRMEVMFKIRNAAGYILFRRSKRGVYKMSHFGVGHW